MPMPFLTATYNIFRAIPIIGVTPPAWLQSYTLIRYKKGDLLDLANYRPIITLASVIYKLWTSCLAILAVDYAKAHEIFCPEQEGFRSDRSCSRAITHLGLCNEDAHMHHQDILLCYLDLKGAFPSTDHTQLM
jgi:hypothetical protein